MCSLIYFLSLSSKYSLVRSGVVVLLFCEWFVMARKANSMTELRKQTHLKASLQQEKKIEMLLPGLGSVRIGKNCDLGLENAALGLRPRAAFSRPTSRPITYMYLIPLFKGHRLH